jgi:hypothetical protein
MFAGDERSWRWQLKRHGLACCDRGDLGKKGECITAAYCAFRCLQRAVIVTCVSKLSAAMVF